jgi:feruloyl-CoA synthase
VAALVFPATDLPENKFRELLKTFESTGSSNHIARAVLLKEPPSLDSGEMTDKGTINQKAVLRNRRKLVDELYGS